MSYDVFIANKAFHITSNLRAVFYDNIPAREGSEGSLRGGLPSLNGLNGAQAFTILTEAFDKLDRARDAINGRVLRSQITGTPTDVPNDTPSLDAKYSQPDNGGSFSEALLFMAKLSCACAMNPTAIIAVYA